MNFYSILYMSEFPTKQIQERLFTKWQDKQRYLSDDTASVLIYLFESMLL